MRSSRSSIRRGARTTRVADARALVRSSLLALSALAVSLTPASASLSRLDGIVEISASSDHTCARLVSGEARCWGRNDVGQLGDGTTVGRRRATTVMNRAGTAPLRNIMEISPGGLHTCARLASGEARCWGRNEFGQIGDGTTTDRRRAATVMSSTGGGPLRDIVQIATGVHHTCARLADGEARCWGLNSTGQLGDGTTTDRVRPVTVVDVSGTGPLREVLDISADVHTCAALTDGEARCWGLNHAGELGDGSTTSRSLPVTVLDTDGVGPLRDVAAVSVGALHTCALLTTGEARCWGLNRAGQLGDGTRASHALPVVVRNAAGDGPMRRVAELGAGTSHTCARLRGGVAQCWGFNRAGQLGDGSTTYRALPVTVANRAGTAPLGGVASLGVGGGHTCARLVSGEARCWGGNRSGQLGDGSTSRSPRPVAVRH